MNEIQPRQQKNELQGLFESEKIKKRFDEILGKRSASFITTVMSVVSGSPSLKACDPMSIMTAAAQAAAMDLPVTPGLGFGWLVPRKGQATFQIGWKGYVQLAIRSGQYKTINATPIFHGQIASRNSVTGEIVFNEKFDDKESEGYLLYFKLLNGYEKFFYMSKNEIIAHAKKFVPGYAKGEGKWHDDFDSMALKTVVRMGLSKYGVLSIQMQAAIDSEENEGDEENEIQEETKQADHSPSL